MSFGSLLFTSVVKQLQERYGNRQQYERMKKSGGSHDHFTSFEVEFLGERDSFYWATIGATGWPYVQHRGGPKGFLKVIDDRTLALADFRGNKQFISTGNLLTDNRVAMIHVDYPQQARLKILGHVDVLEGEKADAWMDRVRMPGYKAIIERVFVIHVEAYDWNCPQHITPRYTAEQIHVRKEPLAMTPRPPLPPFTLETAIQKVRLAEDGWNTRDPEKVSLAYTIDSRWRNRAEFANRREQIVALLTRKWTRELDYRLIKELWAFHENRIAVRFAYEYHDDSGNWFRAYGNENWEFDEQGLMYARHASINSKAMERWMRHSSAALRNPEARSFPSQLLAPNEFSAACPSWVAFPSQNDSRSIASRMRTGSEDGSRASSAISLLATMV